MRKPDDSSLTAAQYAKIREEAERALKESGAYGVFPTPVAAIMRTARVEEDDHQELDEGFLAQMRKKASGALKSALSKVLGLFDALAGLIFIDQTLLPVKKTFIRLHESGHGFLPWQRKAYAIVETCDKCLHPETAELFDREANVFASEVLFQLDHFSDVAEEQKFEIWTPVRLSKDYGASVYAAVRQYVSKNRRMCVVLVLEPPIPCDGDGFRASVRRVIESPTFRDVFKGLEWKPYYTPDDEIGRLVPLGKRRSSGKQSLSLKDANGDIHECVAEAFTQTYQVFVLIHSVRTLTARSVIIP